VDYQSVGPDVVVGRFKGAVGFAGTEGEAEGSLFAEGCDYFLAEGDPVGCVTQAAACYGRDGLGIEKYLDTAKGALGVFAHRWHVDFFIEAEDYCCSQKILILRLAGVIR
jgi:hypothetical protein